MSAPYFTIDGKINIWWNAERDGESEIFLTLERNAVDGLQISKSEIMDLVAWFLREVKDEEVEAVSHD